MLMSSISQEEEDVKTVHELNRSTIAPDERNETGTDEVSSRNAGCKQAAFCYNYPIMSQLTPFDITHMPDLVRIAEEVEATNQPRVLKRDNTPLAILTPVKKNHSSQAKSKAVKAALALAGAWADLPSDRMEEELDRIRHSSKPTPPLAL
jgi:hypothetical protein